jgi:ribonuclease R
LAADYYTHFTSPIRRYPDLMIHRIIREVLDHKNLSEAREETLKEKVAHASLRSSNRERLAQDAERECDQMKMVEYMQAHIDEEFDGIISGVTQFGLFIQLKNGIEGLIHISYLSDDYYVLNDKQMALVGERTRRVFRLGDPVRVKVGGANKEALTIDFELVEHYREGTLVIEGGRHKVEYDEDLSPRDRKRRVTERETMAREKAVGRGRARRATAGTVEAESRSGGKGRTQKGKGKGNGKGVAGGVGAKSHKKGAGKGKPKSSNRNKKKGGSHRSGGRTTT